MKRLFWICGCILALSLHSCQRERGICDDASYYLDQEHFHELPMHTPEPFQYISPVINPNNGDEFIYFGGRTGEFAFRKYNLATGQKTVLSEKGFLFDHQLDWSVRDWVMFVADDYLTYRVKSDGDSLTLMNTNQYIFNPKWSSDGSKLMYVRQTGPMPENAVSDLDGNTQFQGMFESLQSLILPSYGSWSFNDSSFLLSTFRGSLQSVNLTDSTVSEVLSCTDEHCFGFWLPNMQQIAYTDKGRFCLYNCATKEVSYITGLCESVSVVPTSVSRDGRYIMLSVKYSYFVTTQVFKELLRVARYDMFTDRLEMIEIPE